MSLINKSFEDKYRMQGFYYGIIVYSKSEARSIKSEIEILEKKLIIFSKNNFTISYNFHY